MIVAILSACAFIAWTPASGEPEAHYFYEDGLFPIIAFNEQQEVCQPNGEWDIPHVYRVSGFNVEGEGPLSDSLTVVWPSEPVPEPSMWLMLWVGYAAILGLWMWKYRGKDK